MSDPIITPKSVKTMDRADLEELTNQVQILFFFRDVALGVFHQAANYLSSIDSDLLMLETLQETNEIEQVTKHIHRARNSVRAVMGLISRSQKRGATLAPILRDCLINEEVVRPAIEYVTICNKKN